MEQEVIYRIALSRLKGINKALAQHIHETVESLETFFELPESQLQKITGIKGRILHEDNRQTALQEARKEMEFIRKGNIEPLYFTEPNYPQRLLDCIDAPPLLYYRGNADLNSSKIISIVGTRRATEYGKDFCETLIRDLSEYFPQLVIVSGLAYGIDICAHRCALRHGLNTIAVLAHGLDHIYPANHRSTAVEMVSHGGLLTEYTGYHRMHPAFFVARNRIVAGLADAVIIVESREKGGALITAGIAESYHRDVFALPGSIQSESSAGCNHLIRRNRASLNNLGRRSRRSHVLERPTETNRATFAFSRTHRRRANCYELPDAKGRRTDKPHDRRPEPTLVTTALHTGGTGI